MQDGEREPNRARPFIVGERLRTIKFFAYVVRHFPVKFSFGVRKLVRHRIRDAFREERRAVKLEQVFLNHSPHQVRNVCLMNAVAKSAFKAVAVEQRHKELKVLLLSVMRGRSHQQKVARET